MTKIEIPFNCFPNEGGSERIALKLLRDAYLYVRFGTY